jgi:tetratricopeptide (TPR) repeat protein
VSRLHEERVARGAVTVASISHFAGNEYNLGFLLADVGRTDEAMAAYRRSLDLRRGLVRDHPDEPEYRLNVAFTLGNMGNCVRPTDLPAAEGYYREAVAILGELAPKYPKAVAVRDGLARNRGYLAAALRDQGNLDGAIALYQENIRGNAKDETARYDLAATERMRDLRPRLADVLSGAARPTTPIEAIGFAELCALQFQKRYTAAARLYGEAFAADPKLADDLEAGHRYNAARVAALAADGPGEDVAKLDDKERAHLRRQALDWLRANLTLRTKQLEAGTPADRAAVRQAMLSWQNDPALAGLRDAAALAKLPAEEQKAFTQLWADVAALLK